MDRLKHIEFIDNQSVEGRGDHYTTVFVNVPVILKSWQSSLFSFEWMLPDGRIKSLEELSEQEQPKRAEIEEKLEGAAPLEKPILGIGLIENIEIGSGRAVFLTLAAHGMQQIPVHISKSNESDFKDFLTEIE